MRRVLLPILLPSLLLLSRASLGALQTPDFDNHGKTGLRLLPWGEDRAPRQSQLPPSSPAPGHVDGVALVGQSLIQAGPSRKLHRRLMDKLSERLKRPDRQLLLPVIDFVFDLLHGQYNIARAESQRKQAEENRRIIESVGK